MKEVTGAVTRFDEKDDIDQVLLIEQCSFPAPWAKSYLGELENKFARYL